jgi:hypothetical protein
MELTVVPAVVAGEALQLQAGLQAQTKVETVVVALMGEVEAVVELAP